MAKGVPPIRRRKTFLLDQVRRGSKAIADTLSLRRRKMDAIIRSFARDPRFISNAALRDKMGSELAKEYARLQADVNAWAVSQSTKTARSWRKFAIADMARGFKKYDQSWKQFSQKYLDDIIKEFSPASAPRLVAVNARLGGMLQQDIVAVRQAVTDVKRLGAVEGLTRRQQRLEIERRATTQRPAWQFIDRAGKKWQADNYFKMLNKTVANNVSRATYTATMNEAGYDLATLEGGPSTVGDSCDDWVGRIVSTTGATKGYPTLDEATSTSHMFGPNCNHWLGVVLTDVPGELKQAEIREEVTQRNVQEIRKKEDELKKAGKKLPEETPEAKGELRDKIEREIKEEERLAA